MRKSLLTAALLWAAATVAQAGGYLTNTNQSVSFLRNPARGAYTSIDGAYSNPAGVGFMSKGWHMGFDLQSAYQTRTIKSTFPLFVGGVVNGIQNKGMTKTFKGEAKAPVIPSIDLARIGEKWFATFHFGITGGGGKCAFDQSLASFESQVSLIPAMVNQIVPDAVTGYSMDSRMQGRQYYFGGQFGVGYKITPKFNVSLGGRVVYADCNYYGYVRDIKLQVPSMGGHFIPADQFFATIGMPQYAALVGDKELNCDQIGWGFTPIIGLHYDFGMFDVAAKYEFRTRMKLKNRSGENTSGIADYDDGKKIDADLPAILTVSGKYDAMPNLHFSAGFHYYFDKQTKQVNNKQELLKSGGWEVLAGAEYDINKRWTVSAGWQATNYGLGENSQFITDMSFVTNSNSVGFGARFRILPKIAINAAYFKTLYHHYERKMENHGNTGLTLEDNFHRTNDVFGLGMEIDF